MERIIYLFIIVLFFNCTSDDSTQNQEITDENFYALRVGNSWVYKNYKINTVTELYDYTGIIDSISIIGTENLNGNTYYKFRRLTTGNTNQIPFCNDDGEYFELLRDSLGYLVRDDGSIKYANNDFTERIVTERPWGIIYEKLNEDRLTINTEAGSFVSLDTERYAFSNGIDAITPGRSHYYYSDGIGRVFNTDSFISVPFHFIETRLDSYNILE